MKEIRKKNPGFSKVYVQHRLIESYRSERGPRHRTVHNLGTLEIPKDEWKMLANCIENKLIGQTYFKSLYPEHIEELAEKYSAEIIEKRLLEERSSEESDNKDYETVNISSLSTSGVRTLGGEHVGLELLRELGFCNIFKELGFAQKQIDLSCAAIVARLVNPLSEKGTREWLMCQSAMDELLGTSFSKLSNNALYRISDLLYLHKDTIEAFLSKRQKEMFKLEEKIILYDLTNTYFEGKALANPKAKRGRSKEKRHDSPLLTLGLLIDERGFAKKSRIMPGNISEPGTLIKVLEDLEGKELVLEAYHEKKNTTIVIDAGIASEDNLKMLKTLGYDYVCVARNRNSFERPREDDLVEIREKRDSKIEAKLIKRGGENILFCKSKQKELKERSMLKRAKEKFEKGIQEIQESLKKPRGTKKHEKVIERIGRLKERCSSISYCYDIDIKKEKDIVRDISISFKEEKAENRYSGSYFLRTSLMHLKEEEVWSIYNTLTNVESAFRSLKEEICLRPLYHRKEERSDAHIFIAVLAYHLLNVIRCRLGNSGIKMQWKRLRRFLSTHVRVNTSMTTKDARRIVLRNSSVPEQFHLMIYHALGIKPNPLRSVRLSL